MICTNCNGTGLENTDKVCLNCEGKGEIADNVTEEIVEAVADEPEVEPVDEEVAPEEPVVEEEVV